MTAMKITEMYTYPVKSLAGIPLQSAELTSVGFRHDRQWMVVTPDGTFMTQRTFPQMALVGTAIEDGQLVLTSFGMDPHRVTPLNADSPRISTEVWGDGVNAVIHDDATNNWLSQAIGAPCMLVSFPEDEIRQCDLDYSSEGDNTLFADAFPLLLISQESLDELNRRLASPVGMDRFRPNIVVSGCEPHAEDNWKTIMIDDIRIRVVKHCARCSVPTVDQQTGVLSGPEPIHTLSGYRQRDGEVYFGVNLVPDNTGWLSCGESIMAN